PGLPERARSAARRRGRAEGSRGAAGPGPLTRSAREQVRRERPGARRPATCAKLAEERERGTAGIDVGERQRSRARERRGCEQSGARRTRPTPGDRERNRETEAEERRRVGEHPRPLTPAALPGPPGAHQQRLAQDRERERPQILEAPETPEAGEDDRIADQK